MYSRFSGVYSASLDVVSNSPWVSSDLSMYEYSFEVEFVQYLSDLPAQRNAAPEEVLSAAAAMDQAA